MSIEISCPHCKADLNISKGKLRKYGGTILGAGIGYAVANGLGIAGAILGSAVALPATLVGISFFAIFGYTIGKKSDDNNLKCPNCKKKLVL